MDHNIKMKAEVSLLEHLSESLLKNNDFPWDALLRKLGENLSEKEIIKFFEVNHVPFLWLYTSDYAEKNSTLLSEELNEEFAKQNAVFQKTRGEFQAVLNELKTAGIEHIFIKSAGISPSFPWESDNLYVIFHEEDVPAVKEIPANVDCFN